MLLIAKDLGNYLNYNAHIMSYVNSEVELTMAYTIIVILLKGYQNKSYYSSKEKKLWFSVEVLQ